MKVVKPMRLGVVPRVFMSQRTPHLLVTAFVGFSYDRPARLLYEPTVWQMATEELGRDGILDELNPKIRGELLVTGRCYPPGRVARPASSVRVKLGPIDKSLYVIGDRTWGLLGMSDPVPFTEMPVTWRNAFGGEGFARNPLGKGHGDKAAALPNIESPKHLIRARGDCPMPAGFDGYDATWPQRFSKIGTYDSAWLNECFPGFARDLDPTMFNMAPEDQQIDGFFRGDEAFVVENMHPDKPRIEGALPGVAIRCFVCFKTRDGVEIREPAMKLDTVRLFPHRERGVVLFRGGVEIREDDAKDVVAVLVACEAMGAPRPVAYYHEYLIPRLGPRDPDLPDDEDDVLMPEPEDPEAPPLPDDRLSGLASRLRRQGFLGGTPDRAVKRAAVVAAGAGVAAAGVQGAEAEEDLDVEALEAELSEMESDPEHLHAAADEDGAELAMDAPEGDEEEEESFAWTEADTGVSPEMGAEPMAPAEPTTITASAEDAEDAEDPEALREHDAFVEWGKKQLRDRGVDPEALVAQAGQSDDLAPLDESEEALVRLVDNKTSTRLKVHGVDVGELLARARQNAAEHPAEIDLSQVRERLRETLEREGVAPEKVEELVSALDWQAFDDEGGAANEAELHDDIADEAPEVVRAVPEEPAEDLLAEDLVSEDEDFGGELTEDETELAEDEGESAEDEDFPFAEELDEEGSFFAEWGEDGPMLAHLLPAASPLDSQDALRLRHEVEAGHKEGRSFAGADLTGADLSHLDLEGIDFRGAILESAFLTGSNLRKAKLTGAILARANLEAADLSEAKLDGANLGSARLRDVKASGGVDFSEAVLARADLLGADLSGANLSGADLSEAILSETNLEDIVAVKATFQQVDLTGARLAGARLSGCTFNEVNVSDVDFTGVDLSAATFIAAQGEGAVFRDAMAKDLAIVKGSSFAGADFGGATLTGANFMGTRLHGSDLSDVDLRGALLNEADLTEATLDGANLVGAVLTRADLTRASLYAADLRESIMTHACVRGARFERANLFGVCADRMVGDDDTSFAGANLKRLRMIPAQRQHG